MKRSAWQLNRAGMRINCAIAQARSTRTRRQETIACIIEIASAIAVLAFILYPFGGAP